MRISVDTNVLVRAVLQDDAAQAGVATRTLNQASLIAISLPCLCELVWILRKGAKLSRAEVAQAIRDLLNAAAVVMNRPAVEAGLSMLEAGGDFADGVIAYEGAWLGGESFVTFDKQAATLLAKQGQHAVLLGVV